MKRILGIAFAAVFLSGCAQFKTDLALLKDGVSADLDRAAVVLGFKDAPPSPAVLRAPVAPVEVN